MKIIFRPRKIKDASQKKNLLPLSEAMSQCLFEIVAYCLVLTCCFVAAALMILCLRR